jgi:hypothetical protein
MGQKQVRRISANTMDFLYSRYRNIFSVDFGIHAIAREVAVPFRYGAALDVIGITKPVDFPNSRKIASDLMSRHKSTGFKIQPAASWCNGEVLR